LWSAFVQAHETWRATEDAHTQFSACIGRLESRGVVRRLTFGDYVLLEPELLDGYATAIIEAARDGSDGLGSIAEDDVRSGRLRIPESGRLEDWVDEQLLLIATTEVLLRSEVALREHTGEGTMLVFPSQSMRSEPAQVSDLPAALRIAFDGPAVSIYTTLA